MVESRPTTRPRPSLSCATCRRRKVRCTKEMPACNSCVRTNEKCKYDMNAWKKANMAAKQKQNAGSRNPRTHTHLNGIPTPQDEDWVETVSGSQAPPRSRTNSVGSMPDQSDFLPLSPARSARDSNPYERKGVSMISTPAASDLSLSDAEPGVQNDYPPAFLWSAECQDGSISNTSFQQHPRLLSPASTVSAHQQPIQNRPRAHSDCYPRRADVITTTSTQDIQRPASSCSGTNDRHVTAQNSTCGSKPPGYLGILGRDRIRYVGPSFWGYLKGYELSCETILRNDKDETRDTPPPHIDSPALASLLPLLPPQPVCNALIHSFLIGIRPVYPLINVPTFHTYYDDFWRWYSNSDTTIPIGKLFNDPTVICLLFSALHCGAARGSQSLWTAGALHSVERESTVEQLKTAVFASLKAVQYLRFPTLNTLIAILFTHGCLRQDGDPSDDSRFVSTVLRVGQNMGLHLDGSKLGIDRVASEARCRVWWHILWLDVQDSVLNGSSICQHNENLYTAQMIDDVQDKDIHNLEASVGFLNTSTPRSSASTILLRGRLETVRFERLLVNRLNSPPGPEGYRDIVQALHKLQLLLDDLKARLPAKGIPEKGLIPSRIANASPLKHRRLYCDSVQDPTVFTSWARVVLNMLKTEASILTQKALLGLENKSSDKTRDIWDSIIELCTTYLRNFLQCVQVPAFEPYAWFSSTSFCHLQSVFLILTYLQDNRDVETEAQGLYLVDEVLDYFIQEDDTTRKPTSSNPSSDSTLADELHRHHKLDWTTLKSIRLKLSLDVPPPVSKSQQFLGHNLPIVSHSSAPPSIRTPSNTPNYLDVPTSRPIDSYFSEHSLDSLLGFSSGPASNLVEDEHMLLDFDDFGAWSREAVPLGNEQSTLDQDAKRFARQNANEAFTPLSKAVAPLATNGLRASKLNSTQGSSVDGPKSGSGAVTPVLEEADKSSSGGYGLNGCVGHSSRRGMGGIITESEMPDFADFIMSEELWMDM